VSRTCLIWTLFAAVCTASLLNQANRRWFGRAVLRQIRRVAVLVAGTTVLIVGLVMLVAPGPAFVVIPLGLAILATEFQWARRALRELHRRAVQAGRQLAHRRSATRAADHDSNGATN
jgi:uncharacterized protein (TIGR02611 family)